MGTVTDTDLSRPKFLRLIPSLFGLAKMCLISLLFAASFLLFWPHFNSAQVDRLEDELASEQEKLKGITEELEQTFAEMSANPLSGY